MKRYDSITAVKAVSCMIVFLSHWNGAFAGWGHKSLDWLFLTSPFRMLTFGNLAVCIFLMLSGMLVSLKIVRGGSFHWGEELIKRYLRMAVPIFGTHLLVYLLFRLDLFRTGQAASAMGNAWLSSYYSTPISWNAVLKHSFVTSVFLGDSSYYGPLWMMNYIFFGTIFSVVLAESGKEMTKKGRSVLFLVLLLLFLVLDSYYLCFVLGSVLAQLLYWMEKKKETGFFCRRKLAAGLLFAGLFFFGVWLGLSSFVITYRLQAAGIGYALGNASFWGMLSGFFMIGGVIFLWELLLKKPNSELEEERKTQKKNWILLWKKPLLWLGERSYSVFLVHWLVICTFSCGFYCHFVMTKPNWFYLGVNFFASAAVMLVCTELFYQLMEKRLFAWIWNRIYGVFFRK